MTKLTLADAFRRLEAANADYARLIERAGFDINIYRPEATDPQTPHLRDELYIIAAGQGEFVCDGETCPFHTGDLFFVPAGVAHRFVSFSADFATWVVFFGPGPD
jgi:mannose-6-phosphate isomerase-like protein (cupin superfamily)